MGEHGVLFWGGRDFPDCPEQMISIEVIGGPIKSPMEFLPGMQHCLGFSTGEGFYVLEKRDGREVMVWYLRDSGGQPE